MTTEVYELQEPMVTAEPIDVATAMRELRAAARSVRERSSPSFGRQLLRGWREAGTYDTEHPFAVELTDALRSVTLASSLVRETRHYPPGCPHRTEGQAVTHIVARITDTERHTFIGVPPEPLHLVEPTTYPSMDALLHGYTVDPAAVQAPASAPQG